MSMFASIRKHLFSTKFNYEYSLTRSEIQFIKKNYKIKLVKEKVPPIAIFCLDSRTFAYGFADRLRGIISCYAYAKAVNIPFRIEHVDPFELSDYLVPNSYDWQIKFGEKSNNLLYANPVFFVQNIPNIRSMRLFKTNNKRQHHLYTNADYIKEVNDKYNKNYVFGDLYTELFKPSMQLEKMIDGLKLQIGGSYVSVSFRFMQLMGDFKDCYGDVLSEEDKNDLLEKSLSLVMSLYEKEQKTVLVTSDSQTFIDTVSKLNYVYTIPGEIGHIGFSQDKKVIEKMFIDFCMISQAEHVYMAHSGKMYRSNFAKTAAMSNNTPYTEISY